MKALNYPLSTYALKTFGTVVDAMLNCSDKSLAYVVITDGGIVGAGEILRAIAPEHLRLEGEFVICNLSESEWHALPSLEDDHWPTATSLPAHAT